MGGDQQWSPRPRRRPHGVGQDAVGLPVGPRPSRLAAPARRAQERCRVLYVSPMKALAVDVERNLRSPLVGIRHAATRLGLPEPDITVAVRSGDTPADERRAFARAPTDILITTPESLFLLLTSAAREALSGRRDGDPRRGARRRRHQARRPPGALPRAARRPPPATSTADRAVRHRPPGGGGRPLPHRGQPVDVVHPPSTKAWDLKVVVPVPDMAELGQPTGDLSGAASGPEQRASIWPHVEERIVDLVAEHTSTLVFSNSRRLAERLTTRLNEIWEERTDAGTPCRSPLCSATVPRRSWPSQVQRAAPLPCSRAPTTGRSARSSAPPSRRS